MAIKEEADFVDLMQNMKPLHKIAAGLFVLGKISSITTGGLLFVNKPMAYWNLGFTIFFIVACIAICLVEMIKTNSNVDDKIERLEKELKELKKQKKR